MRSTPSATVANVLTSRPDLSVDENGAPVTFEAARWLVCFVPGLRGQFWHCFVHPLHKHVLLLKPNPDGTWTLFEPWWSRLLVRTITTEQALRFLSWAASGDVLLVEEDVPGHCSQFRGWSNCVSLATFVLGRPYLVWTPHGLFKRMRAETHTRRVDVAAFVDGHLATYTARPAEGPGEPQAPPAPAELRLAITGRGRRAFGVVARGRTAVGAADGYVTESGFLSLLRDHPFIRAVVGLGVPPTDHEEPQGRARRIRSGRPIARSPAPEISLHICDGAGRGDPQPSQRRPSHDLSCWAEFLGVPGRPPQRQRQRQQD